MTTNRRQQRQLPVALVLALYIGTPDITASVADIKAIVIGITVTVQNSEGRSNTVHQAGVQEHRGRTAARTYSLPQPITGSPFRHNQSI